MNILLITIGGLMLGVSGQTIGWKLWQTLGVYVALLLIVWGLR